MLKVTFWRKEGDGDADGNVGYFLTVCEIFLFIEDTGDLLLLGCL